ncbi:ABC transporter ATP-binding protein [Pontibacter qinzhouensis]|uniref:ABC transporter ATP-binding protein n=1 Tax=Pontibacter qinzhouensis TaxID=2603253 RepID=A0A5C8K8P0_9BACT|nr:ABC transporter ATP-binding protein [Pontibacter qinzhouensis]TXK46959.1 ABC transporter ATP-binding protein [Pontibacter qinzhouensis]
MSTVIKVENLSKQYRLGEVGSGTISHDLNRWWHKLRGKEDPYIKLGEVNDRTIKGTSDYVWALRDINFEVKQGELLGIIGKNGAGKSTLLKLLSRVASPTLGTIKAKGRIASLLEVGTGFNDQLTGRENVFLNGAILGMTKAEIRSKLDEIIAFSGTERYIDTPVKRYSSGMRVRLAFAVAAHLEPEILIVDEVLAVGDAEFQKKAIGKMQDVSKGGNRTVLFVSHNMAAIQALCSRAILLKNGSVWNQGNVKDMISYYLADNDGAERKSYMHWKEGSRPGGESIEIISIHLEDSHSNNNEEFYLDEEVYIKIRFKSKSEGARINYSISIYGKGEEYILASPSINDPYYRIPLEEGIYESCCVIPANLFNEGDFNISVLLVNNVNRVICHLEKIITLSYIDNGKKRGNYFGTWNGLIRPELCWNTKKVE